MHRPTAAKSPRPRGPETNQQKEHEKKSGKSQKKNKNSNEEGGIGGLREIENKEG
jgi:hypothetical protein